MIELGLGRITRLLTGSALPWRAIHVAGTNGKGSVCAYVSALLHANKIPCGRFTSPHLIDRWDCITINEKTVKEETFRKVEDLVKQRNSREDIQASEFEVLTATAFELFTLEKVKIAAIEVGMGGRLDATNVLQNPLVTVITKIGMDHEAFLGHTIEEIAYQKAGIVKADAPLVVDSSNDQAVIDVILKCRDDVKAGPASLVGQIHTSPRWRESVWAKELAVTRPHQSINMGLAIEAIQVALHQMKLPYNPELDKPTLESVVWPGRLQHLSIESLTNRKEEVLLDGAHNPQSAQVLGNYVAQKVRKPPEAVTWLIAVSRGKDLGQMLPVMVRSGDKVVATEFGPVDGMPWVAPTAAADIEAAIKELDGGETLFASQRDLRLALHSATEAASGGPLVICGSLYLVSDVLRLLRESST